MATKKQETPKMSKDEEVGYHKGALNTLSNERNELLKIIHIVDTFIQGHLKRLEELGVKIQKSKK